MTLNEIELKPLDPDGESGILEMKAAFGCEAAARLAANLLYAACGRMAEVEGGERVWFARIKMPLDRVNW